MEIQKTLNSENSNQDFDKIEYSPKQGNSGRQNSNRNLPILKKIEMGNSRNTYDNPISFKKHNKGHNNSMI